MVHDDVVAVERNLPPRGNFAYQGRARLVLLVRPDILRLPFVLNPNGI